MTDRDRRRGAARLDSAVNVVALLFVGVWLLGPRGLVTRSARQWILDRDLTEAIQRHRAQVFRPAPDSGAGSR